MSTGMMMCSPFQIDSKPRSSAVLATNAMGGPYHCKYADTPMFMYGPDAQRRWTTVPRRRMHTCEEERCDGRASSSAESHRTVCLGRGAQCAVLHRGVRVSVVSRDR